MTRLALLAAILLVSAATSAQTESVVVAFTDDGYTLSTISDTPVEEAGAVLLTHTDSGAWLSRMLKTGDVPAEALASRSPARFRPASGMRAARARRADDGPREVRIVPEPPSSAHAASVRYTVWFRRVPAEAVPDLLTEVEGERSFTNATVEVARDRAEVELRFAFPSVEAWAAWQDGAGLADRFAADAEVEQRSRIEMVRPLRPGGGEIIDLEIVD